MDWYSLLKPVLFRVSPERAHHISLNALHVAPQGLFNKPNYQPIKLMGLSFPNRVGLAAGLDKNAEHVDALAKLGFGFIEVGTVTPKPQDGNFKPRLFRLTQQQALINRMGFNNKGVDYLIERVKAMKYRGILGINIGKNKETANDNALDDYRVCLEKVYPHASYITVNISSPNTLGLRQLQQQDQFYRLISQLKLEQLALADKHNQYKPMVVKLSPDETRDTLISMAQIIVEQKIDGVIATNTSSGRVGVDDHQMASQQGGLSGAPINPLSVATVEKLAKELAGRVPIIGVGGIHDKASAKSLIDAGASVIQLYSGLIYQGPSLVTCLD